ncbi:hypothetical protein MTR67_023027 [Solanum verrucosum]|uniref:Ferric reductase NAD binding domain-containing protein n=1 Tax=Solanum verrucosum TaxID=315347 RepID=A0AAF0QVZ8_SOLVR|nr:hypothetical protein MTR67_023027 [Solanum verrucosum]
MVCSGNSYYPLLAFPTMAAKPLPTPTLPAKVHWPLIMVSASANKLSKLKENAGEYACLIMEELDPEDLGYIRLWQLETLLLQRDHYMSYSRPLSTTTSVDWSPNIRTSNANNIVKKVSRALKCLVLDNWHRGSIILLWLLAMIGLFTWKFMQYKQMEAFQVMGYCLATAKGAAETLKFNMALILLPVCRNMLTRLHSTRARLLIPFADNINFHKTWMYISIPLILYIAERTLRTWRSEDYTVKILKVRLGIGATPFISILMDLLNNTRAHEDVDSNTETSASDDSWTSFASSSSTSSVKKKSQRARSAHFYWVTREPGSLEWFKGVMNEVAKMDHKGQIKMLNYLTSVYEEGDARSTLITMLQALNHAKHGVDILCGTRVRTHFAKPKWTEVFKKIALKHPYSTVVNLVLMPYMINSGKMRYPHSNDNHHIVKGNKTTNIKG